MKPIRKRRSTPRCVLCIASLTYESKSAAIPVATKIHPLRNSAGIVTEWITQYRSEVKISVNGLSPVDILQTPSQSARPSITSTPQFRGTPLLKIQPSEIRGKVRVPNSVKVGVLLGATNSFCGLDTLSGKIIFQMGQKVHPEVATKCRKPLKSLAQK